jgi:flagellar hook-length control protein FliK
MSNPMPPIATQAAKRGADPGPARTTPKDGAFGAALQDAVDKTAAPVRARPVARGGAADAAPGGADDAVPGGDEVVAAAGATDGVAAVDAKDDKAASVEASDIAADPAVVADPTADAVAAPADPAPQAAVVAAAVGLDAGIAAMLAQLAVPVRDAPAAAPVPLAGDDKTPLVAGAALSLKVPVPEIGAATPKEKIAADPKAVAVPVQQEAQPAVQPVAARAGKDGSTRASPAPVAAQPAAAAAQATGDNAATQAARQAAIAALPPGLRQLMGTAGDGSGMRAMRSALPDRSAPADAAALPGVEAGPAPAAVDVADAGVKLAAADAVPADAEPEAAKLAAVALDPAPVSGHAAAGVHPETGAASDMQVAANAAPHAARETAQVKSTGDAPAPSVATQILPAVVSMAKGGGIGRKISISITPNEMGEVSITVERGPNGTTQIQVGAEKLATLELLRRDHGDLVRALGDAGIAQDRSSLSFSWDGGGSFSPGWGAPGGQGGGQNGGQSGRQQNAFAKTYVDEAPALSATGATTRGGIDVTA